MAASRNYLFDVKLLGSIRVDAPDEATARARVAYMLDCAEVSVSDGAGTVTFEASMDGEADLAEVDGECFP